MTDFGISKEGFMSKDAKTATVCGTPEYFGTATPPLPLTDAALRTRWLI
jgi:hypothetical protein